MRKSIELGRAVLSTTTANFELWLTTLITISPQQQCTNLEQRDAASILSLLSSGDVWVGRGQGLHIDLDITLRGQPLAEEQLQQLSEALLEAPVSTLDACTLSRSQGEYRYGRSCTFSLRCLAELLLSRGDCGS